MISAEIRGKKIFVRASAIHDNALSLIGGHTFQPSKSLHTFPTTPFVAREIANAALAMKSNLNADKGFQLLLAQLSMIQDASKYKTAKKLIAPTLSKGPKHWLHQKGAFHFKNAMPATMLSMGVGTGKSRIVIDLIQNAQFKTVLLVCPNHILQDTACWDLQFARYCATDYNLVVLDSGSSKKNAEIAEYALNHMRHSKIPLIIACSYSGIWRGDLAELLLESDLSDLIVFDESHKIMSHNSSTSRFCGRLAMRFNHRLALTGTLLDDSPLDVFGQYRALDPAIFGTSFMRFRDEYADVYDFNGAPIIQRYKNEEQLAEKIAPITFEVSEDVLDIPQPTHDRRTFSLDKEERRVYNDIEETYSAEVGNGFITVANGLVKMLRLQQLTGGWLPLEEDEVDAHLTRIGQSKQKLLEDVLEDLPKHEHIVVFARFTADLQCIKDACKKLKRSYGEISGQAYDKPSWDKGELQVLGVNVQSGEGIDLTRASYAVFYSIGHSAKIFKQNVGRIRRPGMTRFAYFIHLVAEDSIDEAVYQSLVRKESVKQGIIEYLRRVAQKKGKK